MLSAKNNLTSTIELATADGHLMPPAMYSFPQRYHEAYRSELTEFIELVRAGPESKMHRLEQQAMLRHPNVVRTTIAAEMSWKQGMTVQVASIQPHVLPTPEPPQKLLRTQVPEGDIPRPQPRMRSMPSKPWLLSKASRTRAAHFKLTSCSCIVL
eukprot:g6933.t1